jgi:hypothetical protein
VRAQLQKQTHIPQSQQSQSEILKRFLPDKPAFGKRELKIQ